MNFILFAPFKSQVLSYNSVQLFQIVGIFLQFGPIHIFQIVGIFLQFGPIHIKNSLFSNRIIFLKFGSIIAIFLNTSLKLYVFSYNLVHSTSFKV